MILVTGATGNIGRSLVRELATSGAGPVRALTRDAAAARFPTEVETAEVDLTDISIFTAALDGVRSMFLVPQLGPDVQLIERARRAGVEHVVLVSSITVQTHPHLGPAADKAAVEKLLEASGMDWTILRPTQFASNALMWASAIRAGQRVTAPFADTALPTIHPADIASVARVALTEPGHRGRRYVLTGPAPISARQQVATIAAALDRDIEFIEISRDRARPGMVAVFGEDAADAVLDVTGGDVEESLLEVHDTVEQLTGSAARTFAHWVEANITDFR
ncbi:SDR family oxidoreductase [Nocardia caishijiensis]|uniref:Uncharacterized protein YbjT (DUF2867 family) n=1 Tax=Nocardia caishijiensis TaxID=184756 RepID=A0ABQ6YHS6_9NOCA|nr:NAD(P)H-binding protein [Nocardia caishijiensis]KAF0845339.1 uncharacterized protein YbjT (DUF2867 family) [Nocardia caishijiensis]